MTRREASQIFYYALLFGAVVCWAALRPHGDKLAHRAIAGRDFGKPEDDGSAAAPVDEGSIEAVSSR